MRPILRWRLLLILKGESIGKRTACWRKGQDWGWVFSLWSAGCPRKQIKYDEDTISKNERQLKKDREQYAIDEAEFKILKKSSSPFQMQGKERKSILVKKRRHKKNKQSCKTFQHYLRPFTNLVTIWILSKAITKKPRSHPRKQLPIMKQKPRIFGWAGWNHRWNFGKWQALPCLRIFGTPLHSA